MKRLTKTGAIVRARGIAENIYPVRAEGDELNEIDFRKMDKCHEGQMKCFGSIVVPEKLYCL